ncbi:MAG: hypothetical protein ABI045_03335 [Flavobacteriales bacterium]
MVKTVTVYTYFARDEGVLIYKSLPELSRQTTAKHFTGFIP